MLLRSSLILAVAVGLAGCRAHKDAVNVAPAEQPSASPAPSPTEPAPPAPNDPRPLLVCFGDSLTAGFGAEAGASYPDFLQKDLDAAGYKVRVSNEGVSGNTTKDGVERLSGIAAMKPAIVIVEFGGNDGLRGLQVSSTRDNLAKIVATLKSADAKVVLAGITLPPDYGTDYVRTFTGMYASVGKQYSVPVLPFLLKGVYGVDGMMQADRTHATAAGNAIVARNVFPYVTPLLHK